VLTSVNRDELGDGGAHIFAETVRQIRRLQPGCTVEVLIPDFMGHRMHSSWSWTNSQKS